MDLQASSSGAEEPVKYAVKARAPNFWGLGVGLHKSKSNTLNCRGMRVYLD